MPAPPLSYEELLVENERLRLRLEEAEATVEAIRMGMVDAVVVSSAPGESVYTLEGADRPYRLLVETMQQGVAVVNPAGVILYCNPFLTELFKVAMENLIGATMARLVTEADLPVWTDLLQGAGNSPNLEGIRLRRGDGSEFPATLALKKLPGQNFCLLVTDLSLQKQYEELLDAKQALQTSESRFELALRNTGILVYTTDADLRYTWIRNPHPAFGIEDVVGRRDDELLPPQDAAPLIELKQRVLNGGAGERGTFSVRLNGIVYHYALSVEPLHDAHGQVVGVTAAAMDITAQKEAENRINELLGELREADRRKDEFLATLAHELRNPLAPIQNAVILLGRLGPPDPQLKRLRDMIDRQVAHLARMVDDLLEVSRIKKGKFELKRETVDLSKVIQHAVEACGSKIESMQHALTVRTPADLLLVEGDEVRLVQVVTNLLSNAAKFTPAGGHMWLSVEQQGQEAVVCVRDNGPGIPANMLPRVFDLFTQVKSTLKQTQGGLGIGLALVKQLIEMHGGTVEAKSEGPGQGAEFCIRLPLIEVRQAGAGDRQASGTATNCCHCRILVVDDNVDAADSLSLLLSSSGHEVRTAYDGRSGIELAMEFKPEVMLLDLGMPTMDGYQTAKMVRELQEIKQVKLVAVTGWGQNEDRRRTKEAGFDGHLVKPADPALLTELLDSVRVKS